MKFNILNLFKRRLDSADKNFLAKLREYDNEFLVYRMSKPSDSDVAWLIKIVLKERGYKWQ